jgi:hypothetical protein
MCQYGSRLSSTQDSEQSSMSRKCSQNSCNRSQWLSVFSLPTSSISCSALIQSSSQACGLEVGWVLSFNEEIHRSRGHVDSIKSHLIPYGSKAEIQLGIWFCQRIWLFPPFFVKKPESH